MGVGAYLYLSNFEFHEPLLIYVIPGPVSSCYPIYFTGITVYFKVGEVRYLTSKAGRPMKRCEVKVFDNTAPSFTLVL